MIIKTILLFSFILYVQSINTKLYDKAGEYTLNPEDYNYSDTIIISIWGAGSGSTYYYKDDITWYCPGNSGTYASFSFDTYGRTFNFTLGSGGYSVLDPIQNYNFEYPESDGNSSSFNFGQLELILPGGNINRTKYNPILKSASHERDKKFDWYSNVIYECYAWNDIPNGGYGAHSPFGSEGGNLYSDPKCDGYMGSGSGYDCCYCKVDKNNVCIRPYKGGDGALIVYY